MLFYFVTPSRGAEISILLFSMEFHMSLLSWLEGNSQSSSLLLAQLSSSDAINGLNSAVIANHFSVIV